MRQIRWLLATALMIFVLAPLLVLMTTSLARGWFFPHVRPASLDMSAWRTMLLDAAHARALLTSLALALCTGALATSLALPLGRAAALAAPRVRVVIALLAFTAIALPPVALGAGLQLTMLTIGLGGSALGVLLAHTVPATGYLTLVFLGVFRGWDMRIEEASATLGASWRVRWVRVLLPLLRRPIADGIALGFLVSWSQVALTLLVGGGAIRTLPLDVLALLQSGQDQLAAAGALLLAVPPLLMVSVARVASQRAVAVIA
jgi:putative spermidine/putrescine transport system permease protein